MDAGTAPARAAWPKYRANFILGSLIPHERAAKFDSKRKRRARISLSVGSASFKPNKKEKNSAARQITARMAGYRRGDEKILSVDLQGSKKAKTLQLKQESGGSSRRSGGGHGHRPASAEFDERVPLVPI
jgi:hypothetical protein